MKAQTGYRWARLRAMLADLRMPGALEAVDGILHQADSGAVIAFEAIEELLSARSCCATAAGCRRRPRPLGTLPGGRYRRVNYKSRRPASERARVTWSA